MHLIRRFSTLPVSGLARLVLITLFTAGPTGSGALADAAEPLPSITRVATNQVRPGKVVWADLLTGDVGKAATFYHEVFGWTLAGNAAGDLVTATVGGDPVASIASYTDDAPDGEALWVISISVLDVDSSSAAAKQAGGQILDGPVDLPDRGRLAMLRDPQGAVVMLLHASGGDPQDMTGKEPGWGSGPNTWAWAELWTSDQNAAATFYEKVVGYRSVAVKDAGGQVHLVLGRDEKIRATVIDAPLPGVMPNWLLYLQVDDLSSTLRKVVHHGGNILLPPVKDGFNHDVAIVADPTGGAFAVQQIEED